MKWQITNYNKKGITAKYCEKLIFLQTIAKFERNNKKIHGKKHIAVLLESCAYGERVEAICNMTNLRKQ